MRVTKDVIASIQAARKAKGLNQSQLANLLGCDRSTVSKLLSGKTHTLEEPMIGNINHILAIDIEGDKANGVRVSQTAKMLSAIAEKDERVAAMLESILEFAMPDKSPFLPDVPTRRLPRLGATITRIVHQWEEHSDPHYSKIAVEVLDAIRDYYAKDYR